MQRIVEMSIQALDEYFEELGAKSVFLVCGSSMDRLDIGRYFGSLTERTGIRLIRFSDFSPNPGYESVLKAVAAYRENGCDMVAAVGGGSAMDLAKCVKMYCTMEEGEDPISQRIVPNAVPFLAVPTTAGTGSEATRYAIIYHKGEKVSVTDPSCIPTAVVFDPSALKTLPDYHKKATLLDALCHGIESYWSVHSTEESKGFAARAIKLVLAAKDGYLANTDEGCRDMLCAANLAGKAINITATTAGHAMCYKLTTLYGLAHGHAAALCTAALFPYMAENTEKCIDPRGRGYFVSMLGDLAKLMGCSSPEGAADKFSTLLEELGMERPEASAADLDLLASSVNAERLQNHPAALDRDTLLSLYRSILKPTP